MRITGALPTECPACQGLGYTRESQAEMHCEPTYEHGYVEVSTIVVQGRPQVGSACLKCLGLGQLEPKWKNRKTT